MAFAFVQGMGLTGSTFVGDHTSATEAMAFGSPNAVGNMLVAVVGTWDSPPPGKPVTSITDTAGNSWTTANRIQIVSDYDSETRAEIWWIPSCLGGANTVTVTCPSAGSYKNCYVAEYSGAGGALLDCFAWDADNAAGTAHSSGNTAGVATGDLVLGFYVDAATSSIASPTDGKTTRALANTAPLTTILSDSVASLAGEQSVAFSTTLSFAGLSVCVCFKATPRAAPTVVMAASG